MPNRTPAARPCRASSEAPKVHKAHSARKTLRVTLAALAFASVGATAAAQRQDPHVAFVAGRLDMSQPALAACAGTVREPQPATPPVIEVSINGRTVTLETITPDTGPGWRACIENAVSGALTISRAQAAQLPQRPAFMTVAITLGVAVPSTPRGTPRYAVNQRVRVLWGSSWYDGSIVAVQGRDRFLIHYEGWSTSFDEVVGPDRLALAEAAAPTVRVAPAQFSITPGRAGRPERRPMPQPDPVAPPVVVVPPSAPGNLLVNGGFEAPALSHGTWSVLNTIPGWSTVSGPGIEVQAGAAGAPAEGRQLVELDSHAPSAIAQTIATTPRQRYEVRLSFAARAGTARGTNRLAVLWDGQVIARVDADGMGSDQPRWVTVSYFVVATGRRATLELRDEGVADGVGTYVDDVSVTPAR